MHEDLLGKLDEIEAELKAIGFWEGEPNHKPVSPQFELWLQKTFLPNARSAVCDSKLPHQSQVGLVAMRQYDYHSTVDRALNLVRLLNEFDRAVESRASRT